MESKGYEDEGLERLRGVERNRTPDQNILGGKYLRKPSGVLNTVMIFLNP